MDINTNLCIGDPIKLLLSNNFDIYSLTIPLTPIPGPLIELYVLLQYHFIADSVEKYVHAMHGIFHHYFSRVIRL